MLTATEYRRVEEQHTGDLADAMDRAGHAVALAAARHGARYGSRVAVLAGPGNNGGDGYVAARYLAGRGARVIVHRLGPPATDLAKQEARKARDSGVKVVSIGGVDDVDLVVDAVFGGGGRGGVPEELVPWMDSDVPVIAVDFPTGLDPDTGKVVDRAFKAVETVTFGSLKTGHVSEAGPDHCGVVTIADIGISGGRPSLYVAEESDAPRPLRARSAHKWSSGAVLVLGGSDGMVGAAVLAARAALNFGAGAVYLSGPHPEQAHRMAPEIPAVPFDDLEPKLSKFDVVVAGPGLAAADLEPVRGLLSKSKKVLLDAGALVPDVVDAAAGGGASMVLTPHAAEFKRIAGIGPGKYSARSYAGRKGLTLLVKGNPTMITDGDLPVLVMEGGPELASIGTGDVLSGMIAALWARGLDARPAAISGAFWHGRAAADLAAVRAVTAVEMASHVGRYAW